MKAYKNITMIFSVLSMCQAVNAQVTSDQLEAIYNATSKHVDEVMKASAELAASNMPMRIDEVTILTSAVYLKQTKNFIYYGKITVDLTKNQQHNFSYQAQDSFCKSPINRAWTQKEVIYRYIYEMPSGKIDYSFDKSSCYMAR